MAQLIQLTGIARLAAEGVLLGEKRQVEYRSLPTRQLLNRCQSQRVPFHWTVNPYRGCEFGCKYCYARFTHEFLERRDEGSFEREIYAKDWQPQNFRRELRRVRPGQVIGLGTGTDPYQPAERRFGLTESVLGVMAMELREASLYITTKSDLVARDAALLRRIGERNEVRVTLSITSMDDQLARLLEPMAPRPDLKMKTVASLAKNGVSVGVIASPVLPFITDGVQSLRRVAEEAKAAGADHFGANPVFLKPSVQRVFFPFLADKFPDQLRWYQRSFAEGDYLNGAYPAMLRERVQHIRESVGIGIRDMQWANLPTPPIAQLRLF